MTIAAASAEIELCQESCRRLIAVHPRAERIAEIADGIIPLDASDDCRRAARTIRYHCRRIEQLEEHIHQLKCAAASPAHSAARMRESA